MLLERATKAIIQPSGRAGPYSTNSRKADDFSLSPDENLHRVLDVVKNDPVVRGAITTLIDRTLEPGFSFYGKDKKSRNKQAVEKMQELRFERLLRMVLQHLFIYNNAFIEIVRKGDEVVELHTIDPRYIQPYVNKHAEILYYTMQTAEDVVYWKPDEVVHLKTTPNSNLVWGDVDMKALWMTCAMKYHIKKLLLWRFETNQDRPLLNINGASDEQIKRFLTFLEQSRSDIKKLVPIEGEVEAIFLTQQIDFTKLKDLLTYLDYEILNLLQTPPISVGLPDNANRSNSDAQERSLNTRVRSIHRMLEDSVSYDLLPLIDFPKNTLKFNTVDEKVMAETLEMAERMRNMGFKEDLVKDFLESKGWDFPEGKIFDEQLEAQKSDDMFASRQGKQGRQGNDQIGSGDRGTTRKDQLVARAVDPKKYWQYDVMYNEV